MRIAVVTNLWSKGKGGGLITSAVTLVPVLHSNVVKADLIVLSKSGKPSVNAIDYATFEPIFIKYKDAAELINSNYDLVHFLTLSEMIKVSEDLFYEFLDELIVPWVFSPMGHRGLSLYRKTKPSNELDNLLCSYPSFGGAIFDNVGLREKGIEVFDSLTEDNTLIYGPILPLEWFVNVDSKAVKEKTIITQHTRIIDIKRPELLVEMADKLLDDGVDEIKVYGSAFFHCLRKLEKMDNFPLIEWEGSFELNEVSNFLKPAMFNVDFSSMGVQLPQFTILEAAAYGTIPIINENWECEGFVPEDNFIAVRTDHEIEDSIPQIIELIQDEKRRQQIVTNNLTFSKKYFERSFDLVEFYERVL